MGGAPSGYGYVSKPTKIVNRKFRSALPLMPEALLSKTRVKYPSLDAVRGIAALSVFVYHANHLRPLPEFLGPLASHGNAGVPLFFALSGFLIYRPFALRAASGRERTAAGRFYVRRFRRIAPAYWFALTVLAVFPGLPQFRDRWWQLYLFGQGFVVRDPADRRLGWRCVVFPRPRR